jgi:transmembrane protein EpsG
MTEDRVNSVESTIFYLVMFSLSALLFWYAEKRKNKIITTVSLLIPILIGSLRYGVGTDYFTYVSLFENIKNQSFTDYITDGPTEIGFYVLGKLSHLITGNETFLFASFSVLTVLFFYLGLKNYKLAHKPLIFFLFLLTIYPGSFNIMRQSAAAAICFYAFSFILNRKPIKFTFWALIATTLHTSALITIPLYLLALVSSSGKDNPTVTSFLRVIKSLSPSLILLAVLPFLFVLIEAIGLFSRYESYQDVDLDGNNYTFLLKLAILGGLVFAAKRIIKSRSDLSFLSLSAIDTVFTILGFIAAPIKRIGMYFSLFPLLLLPKYIDIFSDRLGKFMCYTLLIGFGVAFFVISYYALNQADILPYKTILERP